MVTGARLTHSLTTALGTTTDLDFGCKGVASSRLTLGVKEGMKLRKH